jgi:uncharacterized coiled-coil protein SlyX
MEQKVAELAQALLEERRQRALIEARLQALESRLSAVSQRLAELEEASAFQQSVGPLP